MSNQFYNYGSSSYDGSAASSLYSIRSAANPYLPDAVSSRLASADPFSAAAAAAAAAAADTAMYSSYDLGADQLYARYSKPTDAYRYSAAAKTPAGSADAAVSGARRSVEGSSFDFLLTELAFDVHEWFTEIDTWLLIDEIAMLSMPLCLGFYLG